MQELSGGGSGPNGEAPRRIEGGPGGYEQQDSNYKPWQQRGPPASDVAPWQQRGREQRGRDDYEPRDNNDAAPWAQSRGGGNYGYGSHHGNYSAPGAASGAAPWQQQAPPPPPGGQAGYGYGYSAFPPPPPSGAPPGLSGAPPGMDSMYYGGAAAPPPPPPGEGPPPPVSILRTSLYFSNYH